MLMKNYEEFKEKVVEHGRDVLGIMKNINEDELLNEDSRILMDELMFHSTNLNATIRSLDRQMKKLKKKELDS